MYFVYVLKFRAFSNVKSTIDIYCILWILGLSHKECVGLKDMSDSWSCKNDFLSFLEMRDVSIFLLFLTSFILPLSTFARAIISSIYNHSDRCQQCKLHCKSVSNRSSIVCRYRYLPTYRQNAHFSPIP